jgi:hypothetical protein
MRFTSSKWFHFVIAVALGMTLGMMPAPGGLSRIAQTVLAVLAFTVVLWMFKVTNNGIASILMMGLRPEDSLSQRLCGCYADRPGPGSAILEDDRAALK